MPHPARPLRSSLRSGGVPGLCSLPRPRPPLSAPTLPTPLLNHGRYVQVFTATLDAFSHGANDVANAMGPFIAVWYTWKEGGVDTSKKTDIGDDM